VPSRFRALPLVLVMATGSTSAFGQQLTCFTVRPGDTVARLAQRFTGSTHNRHQPWFQIVNPETATFVPKSHYDYIQSGWYACVATARLSRASTPPPDRLASRPPPVVRSTSVVNLNTLWVASLFVAGSALLVAWEGTRRYIDRRRAMLDIMKGFGGKFISEFERPLFRRQVAESPIRSQLRCAPARYRLEVLVAPADGRIYPNLVDHRRNVEYDVERVLGLLKNEPFSKDQPFVKGPLRSEGPWVVIPFRYETVGKQEGVP
jgi:hypothetical protein